jgi:hypothetical protein
MGTEFFPGVKRPGRCFYHPPLSSAEVKEKVELYTFVACYRLKLTFTFTLWYITQCNLVDTKVWKSPFRNHVQDKKMNTAEKEGVNVGKTGHEPERWTIHRIVPFHTHSFDILLSSSFPLLVRFMSIISCYVARKPGFCPRSLCV